MYRTIWKFVVKPERIPDFLRYYNGNGTWAMLFRRHDGYVSTELYRDGDAFVTIDTWRDEVSYRVFLDQYREQYEALDRETESFTLREEHVAETGGL